ncbi:hypothetical protein ZWY2020_056469 [Hordeum vulgare]|nr:hypothetical protein ZWY2020_056469 [Hordeum vulgare]
MAAPAFAVSAAGIARPSARRSSGAEPRSLLFGRNKGTRFPRAVGVGGSGWRVVMRAGGPSGEVMIPDGGSGGSGTPPSIEGSVQFESDDLEVPFIDDEPSLHDGGEDTIRSSETYQVTEEIDAEGVSRMDKESSTVKKIRIVPQPGNGQQIYDIDPMLRDFKYHLEYRYSLYRRIRSDIDEYDGGMDVFSRGYEKFGFVRSAEGITYREWAPGADSAALVGDFNNWDPTADHMSKNDLGIWEIFLPNNADGSPPIPHGSRVKVRMDTPSGTKDSIPAWIKYSVQTPGDIPYNGIYYDPPEEEKYVFKHPQPKRPKSLRIYETHVGMSSPVIRFLLSNARWWLEEYKFDGFRFDGATSMMYTHHGLQVTFTGSYHEYFGFATDVDAVVYLMLVNDLIHALYPEAVTIGEDVSGMPTFALPVQVGGVGFDYRLHMAVADKWIELLKGSDEGWEMGNIVHTLTNRRWLEKCVTYAESHDQALVGDKTIAFWLMDKDMYDFMALNGPSTPNIDRGIALHKMIRLITMALGGEGYLNFMGNEFGHPEWIDFPRGPQVLPTGKFIPGNNNSYDKCRRRFDLGDAEFLRYHGMQQFDQAMQHLEEKYGFMTSDHQYVSRKHEEDKVIVFEKGDLVFVFNFHWSNSYFDYRVGCLKPGKYKVVLDSDAGLFGGFGRIHHTGEHFTNGCQHDNRPHSFSVYTPSRTCVVYAPMN